MEFSLFPRAMWAGRNVSVITSGQGPVIMDDAKFKSFTEMTGTFLGSCSDAEYVGPLGAFGASLVYSVAAILAIPFLAVGLALKEAAMLSDKKAQAYNRLAEAAAEEKFYARKREKTQKKEEEIINKLHNSLTAQLPSEATSPATTTAEAKQNLLNNNVRVTMLQRTDQLTLEQKEYQKKIIELETKELEKHTKVDLAFNKYKAVENPGA